MAKVVHSMATIKNIAAQIIATGDYSVLTSRKAKRGCGEALGHYEADLIRLINDMPRYREAYAKCPDLIAKKEASILDYVRMYLKDSVPKETTLESRILQEISGKEIPKTSKSLALMIAKVHRLIRNGEI